MGRFTPTKIATLIVSAESKDAAKELVDAAEAAFVKAEQKSSKKAIKAEDAPHKAAKAAKRARKAEKDAERALWERNNGNGSMGEPYAWRAFADRMTARAEELEQNIEAAALAAEAAERKLGRAEAVFRAAEAAFDERFPEEL